MLTANLMGKMARFAPTLGSRASLVASSTLRPLRMPARTFKTTAAQHTPATGNTQVPVQQQQQQQPQQQSHQQHGNASAQHQQPQGMAQQPQQPQMQHQQQSQMQQQQQPPVGRRLQRRPLSAALSPLADFATVAPGFGRVGGFLRSIEDEMDSMMRALEGFDNVSGSTLAPSADMQQDFGLPLQVDIHEMEKEIVLKADTPGMTGQDVKVTYEPETRTLAISGERSAEHSEKDEAGRFARYERRFGSFQRRFKLPNNVDTSAITAKVINGELSIRVPKTAETKQQQEIKVQ